MTGSSATKELSPFHRWSNHALSNAKVSPISEWTCHRWVFKGSTAGQSKRATSVHWDFELPDGSRLTDPQHALLLARIIHQAA
jgi:hypothetical protein